ncbi:MAG: hypothetical protein MPW13_07070 [Candidatus Manganitrophus sp.]|nr:hypothetical protein [Candidatus Manganitrophus sp.]
MPILMELSLPFSRKKELIGLDIGSGAIKLVQVKETSKGYQLQKFGVKALDPS